MPGWFTPEAIFTIISTPAIVLGAFLWLMKLEWRIARQENRSRDEHNTAKEDMRELEGWKRRVTALEAKLEILSTQLNHEQPSRS